MNQIILIYKLFVLGLSFLIYLLKYREFKRLPIISPSRSKSNEKIAILCPGVNVYKYFEANEKYADVLSINLAAALDTKVTYMLIERLDNSAFGEAQLKIIEGKIGGILIIKNILDLRSKNKTKLDRISFLKPLVFIEAPLKFSKYLSESFVLKYMKNQIIIPSSWKSSLFNSIQIAHALGYEYIDIYGAFKDNGYFWEADSSRVLCFESLKNVRSKKIHATRIGLDAGQIFMKTYANELNNGKIRIL